MRRRGWLLIAVSLSALVLCTVLAITVDEATFSVLERLDRRWLGVALLSHAVALACWTGRLRLLSQGLGYRVPCRACGRIVLANVLAAAVTPSSAGGEPVRVHELYRAGLRPGDATAVVVTERLLDLFLLLVAIALAVVLLGRQLEELGVDAGPLVPATALVVLGLFGLFLLAVRSPRGVKRLLRATVGGLQRVVTGGAARRLREVEGRIDREVDHFHASVRRFAGGGWPYLALALACSAGYWVLDFLVASFVLLALGLPPSWIESLLSQVLVNVIALLPFTPGGAGIAEASAASLYGLFVPSSALGVMIVLWRLIVYHLNILLGLGAGLAILRREAGRRRRGREP
ncbi:MAG TPA: flippase-like domain-containing protein [Methanoregulaceae archaeon]|nr:flippase-like domain-containing protein [Methanoregulaceae archaeon]HQJ87569.1 flippase-like domain-containing protein [Methanoregulaceae archaeon]